MIPTRTDHLARTLVLALAVIVPVEAAAEFLDVNEYEYRRGGFEVSADRGLRFATDDERYELRLGGRLHMDYHVFDDDLTDFGSSTEFDVRRFRLYATLKFFEDWKLKIDGEISDDEGRRGWRNIWLTYSGFERTRLRVGNQIAPMSIEETTSSNDVTFMERSLANALVPSYLTGGSALYYGKERWTVAAGVFGQELGDADEDKRQIDGVSVIGRATWAPWASEEDDWLVHLGASVEYRDVGNKFRLRTRPESGAAPRLIDTGKLRNVDEAITYGLEAAAVWGPFSIQGEYIGSSVSRSGSNLYFDGGYAQVSWLVTGESRRYSLKRATFLSVHPKGRYGALELAARYSAIDLTDQDVIGGDGQNVTVGLNWYLTRYVRAMFNYVYGDLRRRRDKRTDQPQMFQFRIQFAI